MTDRSEAEVRARQAQGLGNQRMIPSRTYGQIFKENVFTFVNIVLFGLGIALILLDRVSDALFSIGVISINLVVSVVREIHAKRIHDHIAMITRPLATEVREGSQKRSTGKKSLLGIS